jgi:xanthine dehydrogenase YagS FAD-binding subunit
MQKFEYASPTTKEQAVALLGASWGEAEVLAGGTDLLSLMKDHIVTPKRVVNIKSIKELDVIRTPRNGSATIGALVSIEELIEALGGGFPAVTQAAKGVASPQMRNMGTVGGDLLQRPRC